MANTLKYGTWAAGSDGSLARFRSELRDAIKGGIQSEITAAVKAVAAFQMPGVPVETITEFLTNANTQSVQIVN